MRCRNCQGELPIGVAFCPNCGTPTANLPPNQGKVVAPTPVPPESANPYAPPPPTSYGKNVPPPPPHTNPYIMAGPYDVPPQSSYPPPDHFQPRPVPAPPSNKRRLLIPLLVFFLIVVAGGSGWIYVAHQKSTPTATGSPSAYTCVPGNLVISGSTALQPLVTKVAMDYTTQCTSATITVQGGGSSFGEEQVEAGQVGIGDSDTVASGGQTDLVDHQVNVVIFGVIVNFHAGVTNLTTAQLQSIYNGTYTNWKQVGGANLPIVVVSRPTKSGTRATFAQYVLGMGEKVTGPASLMTDTTTKVVTEVGQTTGAIGYAATGQVTPGVGANIISIDGNQPTAANVASNTYTFWNIEHMFTKGQPTPIEQALIDYMDSNQGLQEQAALQFVPLTQMQPAAITAHNAVPQPS